MIENEVLVRLKEDVPVIEIYVNPEWPTYKVLVGGKEIENLKSFKIELSNEIDNKDSSAPFYQVEQYLVNPSY